MAMYLDIITKFNETFMSEIISIGILVTLLKSQNMKNILPVKRIGLKILSEERVSIIINTIT